MLTYVFALMHVTGSELPQPAPLSYTLNETSHLQAIPIGWYIRESCQPAPLVLRFVVHKE